MGEGNRHVSGLTAIKGVSRDSLSAASDKRRIEIIVKTWSELGRQESGKKGEGRGSY